MPGDRCCAAVSCLKALVALHAPAVSLLGCCEGPVVGLLQLQQSIALTVRDNVLEVMAHCWHCWRARSLAGWQLQRQPYRW